MKQHPLIICLATHRDPPERSPSKSSAKPLAIQEEFFSSLLEVSFKDADDPDAQSAVPVGWRCGWDDDKALPMARCVMTSCAIFHHHKKR